MENLRRGIGERFMYVEKKGQSREGEWDFHNDLYCALESYRRRGLDEEFWDFLVDKLWEWRAIRGRKEHTKLGIRNEGLKRFSHLQRCFYRLAGNGNSELPTVEMVQWVDVEPFFKVAQEIKGVSSPVFASKLCHFLVPAAYFIFDNTLVKRGWKEYRNYWGDCRNAWLVQADKQALRQELRKKMPDAPCETYPWSTKITELCQFDDRQIHSS